MLKMNDLNQLRKIIKLFFSYKVRILGVKNDLNCPQIECILYDVYYLECGFENHHGAFACGIRFPSGEVIWDLLGNSNELSHDLLSILETFKMIDHYCRKSLPNKYLFYYKKTKFAPNVKLKKIIIERNRKMKEKDINDLRKIRPLLEQWFGNKICVYGINPDKNQVLAKLYDSFLMTIYLDLENKQVKVGIMIAKSIENTRFFGREGVSSNKEREIIELLKQVDKYCQKRLPDKFLKEYFKVYEGQRN